MANHHSQQLQDLYVTRKQTYWFEKHIQGHLGSAKSTEKALSDLQLLQGHLACLDSLVVLLCWFWCHIQHVVTFLVVLKGEDACC